MIFKWLSYKVRFLADFMFFLAGFSALLLPWWAFLILLALCLGADYCSFSFSQRNIKEEKGAAE